MGSDYLYQRIARFATLTTRIPLDDAGHYLDPADRRPGVHGEEARELTSPYGLLHFAVGCTEHDDGEGSTVDWSRLFDYAELPNGRIVLHAVTDSDSGGFTEQAAYLTVSRDEAPAQALRLVTDALAAMGEIAPDAAHDEDGWNQDPYYFARAVAAHCGVDGYAGSDDDALRRGPVPVFP